MKGHAQWWHSELKEKIDTQTRKDPGMPPAMGGGGPVLSEWVADERNHVLGRELTEEEDRSLEKRS